MERVTRGKEINKKGKEKTRWGVCTYRQLAQWNKPTPLTTVSLATLLWRERERERERGGVSLSLSHTQSWLQWEVGGGMEMRTEEETILSFSAVPIVGRL